MFALYNEDHNGLESQPDILDQNASDTRTMMNVTSPITLFVLNEKKELKIVAIQWDYTPGIHLKRRLQYSYIYYRCAFI